MNAIHFSKTQLEKAHKIYDLLSAQGTHYTNFMTWMIGDRIIGYSIYYAQHKKKLCRSENGGKK